MYNYKANSISTVIPKYIQETYPKFREFLEVYYEWQHKTTIELEGTIGNIDFSNKLYGFDSEYTSDIEVVVEHNEKLVTQVGDKRTFVTGEVLIAYTDINSPVSITLDFYGNFLFNGTLATKMTFYRGYTYRFQNDTGIPFYIKDRKTLGANNSLSDVTNNGSSSGIIEITVNENYPRILYFTAQNNNTIGTIELQTIPIRLQSQVRQADLDNISIWGFTRIENLLFHTEYVYNNFENIPTISTPDAFFENYLKDFGLDALFSDNFKKRRAVNDFIRFFQKKGTEDAIKFFFRNFFDRDVSISYPGDLVLKASNSEYFIRQQLFVSETDKGIEFTRNRQVRGGTSNASAIIEAYTYDAGRGFYKLYFDKEKIIGKFLVDEQIIVIDDNDPNIEYETGGRVLGTVGEFKIIEPGLEYQVGETITNTYNIAGSSLITTLQVVDITNTSIQRLDINSAGSGYAVGDELLFTRPHKQTTYYATILPDDSDNDEYQSYDVYIDLQQLKGDYTFTWDEATVDIAGLTYEVDSYNEVEGYIRFSSTQTAPKVIAGNVLFIYFPSSAVIDPFFNDDFFHPSNSLNKLEAKAIVTDVTASGAIASVNITSPGDGYTKRPSVSNSGIFIISESGDGAFISAEGQGFGGLLEITTENDIVGTSFDIVVTVERDDFSEDDNAKVRFVSDSTSEYGKFFKNNQGFLSDKIYIHDSYYYQDYSYVIRSDLNFSDFAGLFRKLAHPAGLIFFNQYFIINVFRQRLNSGNDSITVPKTIQIEKLPSSNEGIDFNLITIQTLSAYLRFIFFEKWLDEFRWRSESVYTLEAESEYDNTIETWSGQTLEDSTLVPRNFNESPLEMYRTTSLWVTVSGTGTIDYSDVSTSGYSEFSTVSGTGTSFTTEVSQSDVITVQSEQLLVYTVESDTELVAQRINTSSTFSVVNEPYEILQKRKTELQDARTVDIIQLGDVRTLEDVSDIPVSGYSEVFIN